MVAVQAPNVDNRVVLEGIAAIVMLSTDNVANAIRLGKHGACVGTVAQLHDHIV